MDFKKSATSIILATIFASASVQADTGTGPNPYKDCGIGAAIFSDTAWAAAISNVIWDLGSTALTSATASPETCSASSVKTAKLINESYDSIALETARGSGEHLSAVLTVAGCSTFQQPSAVTAIRASMSEQVTDDSYANMSNLDKSAAYYSILTQAASTHCGA